MRLIALVVLLAGCSTWQPPEQRAFAVAVVCQTVDLMQTDWALENGYYEANPILGAEPTDNELIAFKAAALGATWAVGEFNPAHRWEAIGIATLPCLAAVAHNYSEGARP